MADFTSITQQMSRGQIARWALHEVAADDDPVLVDRGWRSARSRPACQAAEAIDAALTQSG